MLSTLIAETEDMDAHLANLHDAGRLTFVIRLWVEHVSADRQTVVWRGYIGHALSSEGSYFQELTEMNAFIGRFIQEMVAGL
jgi:hypothetical protein